MTSRAPHPPPPSRTSPAPRAITHVELLVVIGIIALLIAILLPALTAAKAQADALKCAANLRTMGQVMQQYANDNRGFIPRDYSPGNPGHIFWGEMYAKYLNRPLPTISNNSSSRDHTLAPYFALIPIYQCPSFPNPVQPVDYVNNGWDKYSPSGQTQAAFKVTKFRRAGEIIFMTEGNKNRQVDTFVYHDVWHPSHLPTSSSPSERRICDDARHRGNINCVYLDGHVAARPFKSLTEKDFRLTN